MLKTCVLLLVLLAPLAAHAQTTTSTDPWFGQDKWRHFGVTSALAASGYGVSSLVFEGRRERVLVGVGVALTAGAWKERYDHKHGGDASWRDFMWDGMGTASGVAIAWLLDRTLHPPRTPVAPTPGGVLLSVQFSYVRGPVPYFSSRASNGNGSRLARR